MYLTKTGNAIAARLPTILFIPVRICVEAHQIETVGKTKRRFTLPDCVEAHQIETVGKTKRRFTHPT